MRRILIACLLLASSLSHAAALDVNQLNRILKQTGAGWVAKATPISQLNKEDARRMLGLSLEDRDGVSFTLPRMQVASALPAALDWRNKDGLNWVTPVLDQGYCGSCVAFATVATLETQYRISSGFAGFNVKLSPQHLFSCGGGACSFGWFPEAASRYIQRNGVPDEACMPYVSGATGQDVECSASCANASQRMVHISAYTTPSRNAKDIDSVRMALQKGPLVTTLYVYADFEFYAGGIYKHVTGEGLGGHAVSIVGYNDSERYFIIRNSWGTTWGENGFGRVSYDDISGVGDATWSYDMPALTGAVTVEDPVDYTYATGTLPVRAHSTFSGTDSLSVSFFDMNGKAVWNATCAGSQECDKSADVAALADGRYEVQATATDKNGKLLGASARQFFYVANTKPALALSFAGTNGTDLDRVLSDTIQIRIGASSSTVPMNAIEFHRVGSDGQDHVRTASVVLDGMVMGWNTKFVPNDRYDFYLTAHVKTNNGTDTVVESAHKTVTISNK